MIRKEDALNVSSDWVCIKETLPPQGKCTLVSTIMAKSI